MSALLYQVLSFIFIFSTLHAEKLFVLYDAGETSALIPLLQHLDNQKKEFKVLVMATAETITPTMFPNQRITLVDLGIEETITPSTPRTKPLSEKSLSLIKSRLNPEIVLTGTASKVQEQMLKIFSDRETFAYLDNFNYDPTHETFCTVTGVVSAAKHVLLPSAETKQFFRHQDFKIVGKPSLETWKKDIASINVREARAKAGIPWDEKPVVIFFGGYGEGYDIIDHLFADWAVRLRQQDYHVVIQVHPKKGKQLLSMTEALAITDYVLAFNSSVVLDAALVGKKAAYVIPQGTHFSHFAIRKGYLPKLTNFHDLLCFLQKDQLYDLSTMQVPQNSVELIEFYMDLPQRH